MSKFILLSACGFLCSSGLIFAEKPSEQSSAYSNADMDTPSLIYAVKKGDFDAVKRLITNGADINEITQSKECAIYAAFRFPEILKFLIDSGANVNVKIACRKTPLHYAADHGAHDCDDAITYDALCILLENGADVNAVDLYGKTPLHLAMRYLNIHTKKKAIALLDRGANLHVVDDKGYKPFHLAYGGELEFLMELAWRGASLNECAPNGLNALHSAVRHCCSTGGFATKGSLDLLIWLIDDQKMNVNQSSKWSDGSDGSLTPFMFAVGCQYLLEDNFEVLEFLLEHGADINASVHYGNHPPSHGTRTVLVWAKNQGCPRFVLEWLIQHGARS